MRKEKYSLFVDEKLGKVTYTKYNKNQSYTGVALCHPNDRDMFSEKVGMDIAYLRADIKYLQDIKAHLKIKLTFIKDLYDRLCAKENVSIYSVEMKTIRKQMYLIKRDIAETQTDIEKNSDEIKKIIIDSEDFGRRIRANRKKKYTSNKKSTK